MHGRARTAVLLAAVGALAGARCGGGDAAGAKTLVLVTVDTLRRDHVSAYADGGAAPAARTPRIDALARSGLRFADARTPVPLTLPAHTTMMTGLPPGSHGVRSNSASRVPRRSARPWRLLAESLSDAGFCCGAFVSGGSLVERYGLSAGFHAYDDDGLDQRGLSLLKRPGRETVEHALAWLRKVPAGRRAFLWVHLFEPHDPHRVDYRTDVEDADAIVGVLLDGLAAAGRGDAAVLLAADHGESLGELGEPTHGFLLGESVLRVPFVLRGPGVPAAVRADPVELADVAPTLAHLAGVAFEHPDVPVGGGRDLLAGAMPADRPRVAESMHAWHQYRWAQLTSAVVGGWKLEDRGETEGRVPLLFRLGGGAPPWQDAGVPAVGRTEAAAPADALRAYRRAEDRRQDPGGVAPPQYQAGGPVGFFLSPAENGRRNDPYTTISDSERLGAAEQLVVATPPLAERLDRARIAIEALRRRDPKNPAVSFWLGRLERTLAHHALARAAFEQALELGRWDAETLLLAGRSAVAEGKPADAIALLEAWRARIPPDDRLLGLESEAWGLLGDGAKQKAAADRAAALREPKPRPDAPADAGCK